MAENPLNPWFVLVLNDQAEGVDPEVIQKTILKTFRGGLGKKAHVFVPAGVDDFRNDRHISYLFQGYAFVQGVPEHALAQLNDSAYVDRVLSMGNKYATVTQTEIDDLVRKATQSLKKTFHPGEGVLVLSGPYCDMEGEVLLALPGDTVQVLFRLRSKEIIQTLPVSFLQHTENIVSSGSSYDGSGCLSTSLVETSEIDLLLSRVRYLSSLPSFKKLLNLSESVTRAFNKYQVISGFQERSRSLLSFFGPFVDVTSSLNKYLQIRALIVAYQTFSSVDQSYSSPYPSESHESRNRRSQSGIQGAVRSPQANRRGKRK